MRRLRCSLAFCCVCVAAVTVRAQAALSPSLSALPQGFQFSSSWDCEGSFRNGQVHKSTFTGSVVVGGKWLELTEQDVEPATGYVAEYLIGYDADQKRLVEFDANNFSAATYSSEEGWKGGVLTMTSPISRNEKAPYAANRFVYTLAGTDSFTVDWQISKTAALNWVGADHLACRRRARG